MMSIRSKVVSLQDIANLAGVHKSTVHRALRGDPRVEASTVVRIRELARKLRYNPDANQAARRLSLRKTGQVDPSKLVALCFPVVSAQASYFIRQFLSFMEVLSDSGTDVLTRILDRMPDRRLPPAVVRGEVDAVVALAHPAWLLEQQAVLETLTPALRRPLITLINTIPGAWAVTADFRKGGRLSIGHLIDLGHRRFITITNMAFRSDERITGYREELVARGMDPELHIHAVDCDTGITDPRERLANALDRLLAEFPDATTFLAPNDPLAAMSIALFDERGRRVPDAMSVCGFDDTDPVLDAGNQNILTSVAIPLEQIGRQAARLALDPGPEPQHITLPVGLRIRGTTRPPRL